MLLECQCLNEQHDSLSKSNPKRFPQNAECNLHKITMVKPSHLFSPEMKNGGNITVCQPKKFGSKAVFLNYLLRHQCREQCNCLQEAQNSFSWMFFLDAIVTAQYNATLQWHHTKLVVTPCNGTQQCHHVHCTLQWHPGATSNPPLLEVRTPMAIAIWGKKPVLSDKESA